MSHETFTLIRGAGLVGAIGLALWLERRGTIFSVWDRLLGTYRGSTSAAAFDVGLCDLPAPAAGHLRDGAATDLAIPLWSSVHGLASLLLDAESSLQSLNVESIEKRASYVTEAIFEGLRAASVRNGDISSSGPKESA